MAERVYLDWNATAPLRPRARAAMLAAMELNGNPSSIHAEGRAARAAIESAREVVAGLVGGQARDVVFTSGGTEANALVLAPGIEWPGGKGCRRLLVSAIEHPSVLAGGRFPAESIATIAVTADGVVDLGDLAARLGDLGGGCALVSVMLANNETGAIQPIATIAEMVHAAGCLLHVDAVQAAGKIPIDIKVLKADLVTLSGHKFGAPKGVGALVRASGDIPLDPLIRGGGQERRLRAGTENVAAIAGMGAAIVEVAAAMGADHEYMIGLRDRLEVGLRDACAEVTIFAAGVSRLPNTTLFAIPGLTAETALIAFDLAGIAVSSGSACSSGKVAPSHVLAAMGAGPELASGAIRVSLGRTTTETDVERFLEALRIVASRLNKASKIKTARAAHA